MADTKYAVKSGFYDAINHDRVYSADDMNQPYKMLFTEGIIENSGGGSNNGFEIYPAYPTENMTVIVARGHALLQGRWVDNAAELTVTVPENSSMYDRIDSVFLRVDKNNETRAAFIIYRTGTPAAEPSAPASQDNPQFGLSEVRLANIAVVAGATSIPLSKITDTRGTGEYEFCKFNIGNDQVVEALMDIIEEHPELITAVPDGGITTAKLAAQAVTGGKLASNSVSKTKIIDGAVETAKLADGAVTGPKIATRAVEEDNLGDESVTTTKIGNSAVTMAKLASDVKDELDNKANIDGYYDGMTVGQAEQVLSNVKETERSPYLFRASGGSLEIGDREEDTLVGMDLVWNQLVANDKKDYTNTQTDTASTFVFWVGGGSNAQEFYRKPNLGVGLTEAIFNASVNTRSIRIMHFGYVIDLMLYNPSFGFTANHKYFISLDVIEAQPNVVGGLKTENLNLIDLTAMFGSTIADYIYSLEQGTAGAGVAWVKRYLTKDYYPYSAPTMSNGVASSHDMVGFNQYDNANPTINVIGGTQYQITGTYTSISLDGTAITPDSNGKFTPSADGTLTVTGGNSTNTCVHFAYDGEKDGEYEPYVKHSYPLDDTVDLHGIPMIDASGNLYADGDTYEADGTVTRRYHKIDDISLLSFNKNSDISGGSQYYVALPSDYKAKGVASTGEIIFESSSNYTPSINAYNSQGVNYIFVSGSYIWITSDKTTVDGVKADFSGKSVVYEIATPTTESFEPFQTPQIVDNWGTEEYVTSGNVPIGHTTDYPINIKAKVEVAPDAPEADGTYLMQRLNGVNSYIPFVKELPAIPSEDGNYLLGLAVSGSGTTKTLSWEVQS